MSAAIKVSDFVASDSPFVCKEQISPYGAVRAVVDRVTQEGVPVPGTSRSEARYVVWFKGWRKGVVVGSRANRKWLATHFGGTSCAAWAGRAVWLYVDPTATYGGKRVGGIRFAWGDSHSGAVPPPRPTPTDEPRPSEPVIDPSEVPGELREPGQD
jgi:hypothetical protein